MQDQNTGAARPLAELSNPAAREQNLPAVTMGFGSLQSFELMQRAAKMLAYSTLVPVAYRANQEIKEYGRVTGYTDNPAALPNCVVALNMAQRMGADPLMVMQNLYIVEGRPSWSSQFIIAAINSCGRYSPLRFELSAIGELRDIEYTASEWVKVPGQKDQRKEVKKTIKVAPRTCVAWAIELATGDRLESPVVSMDMAVAEGWIQKNGSKWQTMPEVMLRYRAAAFFGKLYSPELLMGLQTAEEAHDIIDIERQDDGKYGMATTLGELRSTGAPEANGQAAQPDDQHDDAAAPADQAATEPAAATETETAKSGTEQPETAPEAAKSAPIPAKTGISPEMSEAYERLMGTLNRANSLSQLADAYELVGEIGNQELRNALTSLYKQRYAEFNTTESKPAAAAPAAPAKRTRRTTGSGNAPE